MTWPRPAVLRSHVLTGTVQWLARGRSKQGEPRRPYAEVVVLRVDGLRCTVRDTGTGSLGVVQLRHILTPEDRAEFKRIEAQRAT